MNDWLFQRAREVVGFVLTAALTWVAHTVARLVRDLNASFEKIRCLEERVKKLEGVSACKESSKL